MDRIAIAMPINEIHFNTFKLHLHRLHTAGVLSWVRDRSLRYMDATYARMKLKADRGVTIMLFRSFGRHRIANIKLDWSPKLITEATRASFNMLVSELIPGGVEGLLSHGIVRYFETAIDVEGERVEN